MKKFINYNGSIYEEGQAVLSITDHSYRYGDGLFETMKMVKGDIMLKDLHFERLYSGLKILKFNVPALFTKRNIQEEVKELCKKNKCEGLARVRLSVSRGNGGLYDCDDKFSYSIGCWPLEQKGFNEKALPDGQGLVIDIFPDAKKSIDAFSNLKSANYLPYTMAAVWAKENKLNDALILNQHNRICDATIANVFWIKDDKIYTPPLSEGCVAGVMRRWILDLGFAPRDSFGGIWDFIINEAVLTKDILLDADEVFLTNVTTGIRWVQRCSDKVYTNTITTKIFAKLDRAIN
jgi:branched-chain amino acid aminotransferase